MDLEDYIDTLKIMDRIDGLLFILLIVTNIYFWNKRLNYCLPIGLYVFLIGILLPFISMGREIDRNEVINGPAMDSFELFYTFAIFPVYWVVLVFQLIYLSMKPNPLKEKDNISDDILDADLDL